MRIDSMIYFHVVTYGLSPYSCFGVLQILIPLLMLAYLKSPELVLSAVVNVKEMNRVISLWMLVRQPN